VGKYHVLGMAKCGEAEAVAAVNVSGGNCVAVGRFVAAFAFRGLFMGRFPIV